MPGPDKHTRSARSPGHPALLSGTGLLLALFLLFCGEGEAFPFPFRTFSAGDTVPAAGFVEHRGKQHLSLADLNGQDFLAVFWGADLPEKKERSILILRQVRDLTDFFQANNIRVLSVNIQGDSSETIDEVLGQTGGGPVFVDPSREVYGILGVYVMPTLLLVDKNGKAVVGLGFGHSSVARMKGEIEILRGKKTLAQVEEELHPTMIEKSPQEKQANQHLNFGLVMQKRGRVDVAVREFESALALAPDLTPALIALGCLYLETGNPAKAEETINSALALAPASLEARICAARLGKPEQAGPALEKLLAENPQRAQIAYLLGRLREDAGQTRQAAEYYRRAYELLKAERDSDQ